MIDVKHWKQCSGHTQVSEAMCSYKDMDYGRPTQNIFVKLKRNMKPERSRTLTTR